MSAAGGLITVAMVNKYRQHAIKRVFERDSLKLMLILCYQIDELLKLPEGLSITQLPVGWLYQ